MTKKNKKYLVLTCGPKGGSGKSTLTWMIIEKYKTQYKNSMKIYDSDTLNKSISNTSDHQIPQETYDFFSNEEFDSSKIFNFIDEVSQLEENLSILDCSSTVSESLIKSFKTLNIEDFNTILNQYNIELIILSVIIGASDFFPTIEYAINLKETLSNKVELEKGINYVEYSNIKFILAINQRDSYSEKNNKKIEEVINKYSIEHIYYTLNTNKGEGVRKTTTAMLSSCEGVQYLPLITRLAYTKQINLIDIIK